MSAVPEQAAKVPPRQIVRVAWVLHRALYRFTGGRIGLRQPVAGDTFGMLRLTTIGRRSHQPRVVIIGYFEDGNNLVTLAMNGWGTAEPAWWLNLQSNPDATIDLADSRRTVRARAATGSERDRLWARVSDFPGWGDDVDALAARRAFETTVVVFEPSPATTASQSVESDTRAPSNRSSDPIHKGTNHDGNH